MGTAAAAAAAERRRQQMTLAHPSSCQPVGAPSTDVVTRFKPAHGSSDQSQPPARGAAAAAVTKRTAHERAIAHADPARPAGGPAR
eukprot:SAG22_NODE_1137_length_5394_cov_15.206232_1_plen_85_part_10